MEAVMRWQRNVVIAAIVVMIASAMVALCGCSTSEVAEANSDNARFCVVDTTDNHTFVVTFAVVDKETGCQYLFCNYGKGGGLTLLVDKYGNPLLADGYSRREVGTSDDDGE